MINITFTRLALPALAALALLIPADPAFARGGGGGHGGGGFHGGGGGFRGGYGGGGYRGGYGGYRSYDRGYGNYGYGYPYYWGGGYYPYYSDYGVGDYSAPSTSYYTPPSTDSGYQSTPLLTSNGGGGTSVAADNVAHITVRLPDQAELRFDNKMLMETGAVRQFTTPPLTAGQRYTYTIRARWLSGDSFMDQEQKITLRQETWLR